MTVAHRTSALLLTVAVAAGLHRVSAAVTPDQERPAKQDYSSGAYLYSTHCASCHGPTGRGDGPAASTFQRPMPDLTTLTVRAGSDFPRNEVTRVISGERTTRGHTAGDMPDWSRVLESLEGNDRTARRQIDTLVKYLESIQQK
jgi:mono/diheme cytochrome c family protein